MTGANDSKSGDDPLESVRAYYAAKIAAHGAVPEGVDWGSADRQERRFAALSRGLPEREKFSLLDIGCGYGALWDYLRAAGRCFTYHGVDIAEEMIRKAVQTHPELDENSFSVAMPADQYDYVVASGIFNVRGETTNDAWRAFVFSQMKTMFLKCRNAVSCNFLTAYSDPQKKQAGLHYADPCEILDFCIREFSMDVDVIHHYGAWDFTVHIFKQRPAF